MYSHRLALIHQLCYFLDVILAATHDGSHELCRVVCLEISRLESHPRIACGMRLVERIGSKSLPVAPNLLENLWIVTILLAALNELRLHCIYDVLFLLTHRLTKSVTLTSCEVGQ